MVDGYRLHFSHTAEQLGQRGRTETAEQLLTNFTESVPFSTIPADMQTLFFTAQAYRALGNTEKVATLMEKAEPIVLTQLRTANSRRQFSIALRYAGRLRSSYLKMSQKATTENFDQKIDKVLANAPYRVPVRIRRAYGLTGDTTGEAFQPSGPMTQPSPGNAPQQSPQPSSPSNQ